METKKIGRPPRKVTLVSPEGVEQEVVNITQFAREQGLNQGNLSSVIHGRHAHCQGWHLPGADVERQASGPQRPLGKRFWRRVERRGENECWPWFGSKMKDGYGRITVEGRQTWAHRVAWTLLRGPIPSGARVQHRCGNKSCCNPEHLYLSTDSDGRLRSLIGQLAAVLSKRGVPEERVYRAFADITNEAGA